MFDTFLPERALVNVGSVAIHWYGLFAAVAAVAAFLLGRFLAKRAGLSVETVGDAFFVSLVLGFIGARLWHVVGDLSYYLDHPAEILAVWNGGLALHGGLAFGGLALFWFAWRKGLSFLLLADLFAPLLALAHAIGRWGNYFNQELFGRPTDLPWGIPIALGNRPSAFSDATHFHPTFLYESLGLFAIAAFLVVWFLHRAQIGHANDSYRGAVFAAYLVLTGALRIGVETLRVDVVLTWGDVRVPLVVSLLLTFGGLVMLLTKFRGHMKPPPQPTTYNLQPQ
ncbi:MAG: prolipoprotein diacylglyceryl transferase [Candidatus Kerfeldbacteria bacterium]|nr:prolipoprotein diacylglyceryl transferase [Candidatus Kerfeldbacteria bacterium]